MKIVLGIDPGFSTTGFGIMKQEGQRVLLLDYGALTFGSLKSLPARISRFYDFFAAKLDEHKIQYLALETPFLGKNAQNFLKLGYLRGILYLLAYERQVALLEFSPREVKKAVTGFGAASKEQIACIMTRFFRTVAVPKKLDVTDALAVTLCGLWSLKQVKGIEKSL